MTVKFKKTYRFAGILTAYVTFFSTALIGVMLTVFFEFDFLFCLIFAVVIASFTFFIAQYRVERFIYSRIKKIYDDVSILESSMLQNAPISTDMATLSREVAKFAVDKKLEIETLKEREEYRREFLGNVSHELKTPLFTVQGYISTLLDGAINDKKIRMKYLERAEKGVERLIYIVQDLDMISKMEIGELNLQVSEFDIVKLVQNVLDLLEIKADKKDILLTLDRKYTQPIMVEGDQEKIQQVVINLVANSIKYGKENGSTEISIEDFEEGKIIVKVSDNGEGIESQHIPRLFERFYRVEKSRSRVEGGSGLGLAIVKHILEVHHEKIFVKSQPDVGSEFCFTLKKAGHTEE